MRAPQILPPMQRKPKAQAAQLAAEYTRVFLRVGCRALPRRLGRRPATSCGGPRATCRATRCSRNTSPRHDAASMPMTARSLPSTRGSGAFSCRSMPCRSWSSTPTFRPRTSASTSTAVSTSRASPARCTRTTRTAQAAAAAPRAPRPSPSRSPRTSCCRADQDRRAQAQGGDTRHPHRARVSTRRRYSSSI